MKKPAAQPVAAKKVDKKQAAKAAEKAKEAEKKAAEKAKKDKKAAKSKPTPAVVAPVATAGKAKAAPLLTPEARAQRTASEVQEVAKTTEGATIPAAKKGPEGASVLVSALGLSPLASVSAATTFGAAKSSSFSGAKKSRAVARIKARSAVRTVRTQAARPKPRPTVARPKPRPTGRRVSSAPGRKGVKSQPRAKVGAKSNYQKKREQEAKKGGAAYGNGRGGEPLIPFWAVADRPSRTRFYPCLYIVVLPCYTRASLYTKK